MNTYTITTQDASQRLDVFCTNQSLLSRTKITEMILNHLILLNGKPAKPKAKLKVDDIITIQTYTPKQTHIEPIKLDLSILYEDNSLLVVHKPRGLIMHPTSTHKAPTLLNGLVYHFQSLGLNHTPGLVHRIDKDTEGLVVIAKDVVSHNKLATQLLDKTLHREYIAVTHNKATFDTLSVNQAIGHHPTDSTLMSIHGLDAKPACTLFETIASYDNYSVFSCTLQSGRTHQIRVHAAFINHPLIGDKHYGPTTNTTGQALCAYKLSFLHPKTNQPMTFTIPYDNTLSYALQLLK